MDSKIHKQKNFNSNPPPLQTQKVSPSLPPTLDDLMPTEKTKANPEIEEEEERKGPKTPEICPDGSQHSTRDTNQRKTSVSYLGGRSTQRRSVTFVSLVAVPGTRSCKHGVTLPTLMGRALVAFCRHVVYKTTLRSKSLATVFAPKVVLGLQV